MLVFLSVVYLSFPPVVLLVLYTAIYCRVNSTSQFVQLLATNLMNDKHDVNFVLARGLGSAAWPSSALLFSFVIDAFDPTILGIGYIIFNTISLVLMNSLPKASSTGETEKKNTGKLSDVFRKYPVYIIFLTGFSLMLAAASSLGTYLINIVNSLGGYLQDAMGLNAMYVSVVVMTVLGVIIATVGYILSKQKRFQLEVQK